MLFHVSGEKYPGRKTLEVEISKGEAEKKTIH